MEYYILEGHKVKPATNIIAWGRWFESAATRSVAKTEIGSVMVSTVFLGLDHSFGQGKPLLFETMVFGGKLDQEQERYTTWDEAMIGHTEMVKRVNAAERG